MPKADIHNPGKAPRVIHGGEDDKSEIRIGPGETARGVDISDGEVARLKKLADESPPNTELLIKETGRSEPAKSADHSSSRRDADEDAADRSRSSAVTGSFKKS